MSLSGKHLDRTLSLLNPRFQRVALVPVRVELAGTCHNDDQRRQRVKNFINGIALLHEHVGQPARRLGRFVKTAAAQNYAAGLDALVEHMKATLRAPGQAITLGRSAVSRI